MDVSVNRAAAQVRHGGPRDLRYRDDAATGGAVPGRWGGARRAYHPGVSRRLSLPILVLVLTAAALLGGGCGTPSAKQRSTVSVFLKTDVTADQRAAIDRQLRGMPTVRDVAFVTKQQAYEHFRQQFKDQPDLLAGVGPDTLPESYTASAESRFVEAIQTVLTSAPGVDDVTVALPDGVKRNDRIGMILQLTPDVTGEQRTAIEAAVRALPDAKPARFEAADAAHTRLRNASRGEPTLTGPLDATSAFASYRFTFTLTAKSYGSREYIALTRLAGVRSDVIVPAALV